MKILVNACTLIVGGGIQIGKSFIEESTKNKNIQWLFLVSKSIYNNLSDDFKGDKRIIVIKNSPARPIKGALSRNRIHCICKIFKPDIVYSLGFPSYIKFKTIEIGRYTNPWEINPEPLPWHKIGGIFAKTFLMMGMRYRMMWAKNADYIETQTESAKQGINQRIGFNIEKIFVIPNSPNRIYEDNEKETNAKSLFEKKMNTVFCLSAPYEHKDLDLIPQVAFILKQKFNMKIKFILTIPDSSKLWNKIKNESIRMNINELIINVGTLKVTECIEYYKKSKIVFMPTLLEVFSATYLEAMAMKVPIVTSDLEFAHNNCKDAAIYFKPDDAYDAAKKIAELTKNLSLYEKQINKGIMVLKSYPTLEEKFELLYKTFQKIRDDNN